MLVDTIGDTVGARYSGMPSRLYLIDHRGRVAYKSGRGPFGFKPAELEHSLILLLQDEFPELKPKESAATAAAVRKDDARRHASRAAQDGADGSAVTRSGTSRGRTAWTTRIASRQGLSRRLGLATATAMVVGEVIGVGIFLTPAEMAQSLGSPAWLIAVWLIMGASAIGGASASAGWRRGIRRRAGSTSTSARRTGRGSASSTAGCRCW